MVVSGAAVSNGEGAAGGALVGVAGLVDRPDLEAVEAVGEVGVGLGRGAGGEAGAVELAFEGGDAAAGCQAREGEGGVVVGGGARRAGEDGGLGGGGVDGEGAAGEAVGRCCRPGRSPGPRSCGGRPARSV